MAPSIQPLIQQLHNLLVEGPQASAVSHYPEVVVMSSYFPNQGFEQDLQSLVPIGFEPKEKGHSLKFSPLNFQAGLGCIAICSVRVVRYTAAPVAPQ